MHWRKYLPGLALLGLTLAGTVWTVKSLRLPGQSNMLESLAMDMNGMKPAPGALPVGTVRVVMRRVQPELSYTGSIRGYNEVAIAARVDGRLSAVPVYAGTRVNQGQVLARLMAPELNARTRTAQTEQAQTRQELSVIQQEALRLQAEERAAHAGIQAAQAELASAQANADYWRERLPREQELYQAGGIALEEFQRYQADARITEATVNAAHQRVQAAHNEQKIHVAMLGENRARLHAQEASIRRAGANLQEQKVLQDFTQIHAPFSGIITQRLLAPGAVVTVGTPILNLAQIDPVRIQIPVPEADLAGLKVGGNIIFSSASHPNDEIEATISSITPVSSPGSRTHLVEALLPNPEGLLLPGQYIKARLRSGDAQLPAPALPERALVQIGGQDSVWTVRNGRAHLVVVTVEASGGDWAWISGLEKDTLVISDNYENLQEGLAVTPVAWGENGPERLPEPGGALRLNASNRWSIKAPVGEYLMAISLIPQPPVNGNNTLRFELQKGAEKVTDARLRLETAMPSMNMAGPSLTAREEAPGIYTARFSGMSGLWQVVAVIESEGKRFKPIAFEFNLP